VKNAALGVRQPSWIGKNRKALLDKIQQPTHEEAMQIAMAFIDGRAGTTARTTTWLA
jgi:hypothetical protein